MMYSIKKRENPLNRESDSKFYAAPEYGEEIDVQMLAKEISKSCTLNQTDIVAVIESLLTTMPMFLMNSNRIRLNRFGIFKLSFSSSGHEHEEDVTSNDIKTVRVLFLPCAELKRELEGITYMKR